MQRREAALVAGRPRSSLVLRAVGYGWLLPALAIASMALAACTTASGGQETKQDIDQAQTAPAPSDVSATPFTSPFADEPLEPADLEEKSGLRLLRATVTAQGGMIDLRYEVVDAAKAKLVIENMKEAVIIDEATGEVGSSASVAKLGELRQLGSNRPGQVNYILFANPGGAIKPGAGVIVVAGDMPLGRLLVQ